MGVLRRSSRPKSLLVTKNPTGLPTSQPETDQAPSASLLAAQAAALSFKSNTELPTTQKTAQKPTISRSTSTRRLPTSSSQRNLSKNNIRSIPTIKLENLSISDTENDKRLAASSTTSKPSSSKVVSNIKRNSITNSSSLVNNKNQVINKPLNSTYPIQPPQISSKIYSRNTSSSSFDSFQSAKSSNNSFDFHSKPQTLNFHKFSDNDYGESSDAYDDELSDEMEENNDNENSDSGTEFDNNYIGNFRYEDSHSNLDIGQHTLQPVPEVASPKSIKDENKSLSEKLSLNEDVIFRQPRASIQIPIRKPPPNFNLATRSTDDIALHTLDKHLSSPRRKAPINTDASVRDKRNSLASIPLSTQSELKSLASSVPFTQRQTPPTSVLSMPYQYSDSFLDDPHVKEHKRSSSYGFRKNAKKILKKSFKSSSNHHNQPGPSIAPKPVQLKTTMRKEKKSKFNEDKPWRNHDDRHFITEPERKRYEGVWASNKGLYMEMIDPVSLIPIDDGNLNSNPALWASKLSTNSVDLQKLESNLILNQVVKEIWSRSRLGNEILQQIWDLIDYRKDGTLDKRSFIVGMWYVDQCLYGRKLPKSVGDDVWNSVSHMGLNVIIKGKKRK